MPTPRPAFIDSINRDPKVDLVVHVGDIHSGKQYCTETDDHQVFDLWTGFKDPLIYAPGDNEWADCHKAAERGGVADADGDTQADLWDLDGKPASHLSQYEPFVATIVARTKALGKPVLLFNGDSHVYRSDNPLSASDPRNGLHPGYDVPSFHRVVVHGSTFPLEWLRLTIDPRVDAPAGANAFGPFSWTQVVQ